MSNYLSKFNVNASPVSNPVQTLTYKDVRFTVITPELLRVEASTNGLFCDEPTQSVLNRDLGEVSFTAECIGKNVIIKTSAAEFNFNLSSLKMESITLADKRKVSDYHKGNLRGTCRTLDGVNGKTNIGEGVISINGVAVLDDSTTLVLKSDGRVLPRDSKESDTYYFAYGFRYRDAIRDLFKR